MLFNKTFKNKPEKSKFLEYMYIYVCINIHTNTHTQFADWRSDAGTTASVVMYIEGCQGRSNDHLLFDQDIDNFQVHLPFTSAHAIACNLLVMYAVVVLYYMFRNISIFEHFR